MARLVCQRCEIQFKPEKNGVYVAELCFNNDNIYKLWIADSVRCPVCGTLVVAGFAKEPLMTNASATEQELRETIAKIKKKGGVVIFDRELIGIDKARYEKHLSTK